MLKIRSTLPSKPSRRMPAVGAVSMRPRVIHHQPRFTMPDLNVLFPKLIEAMGDAKDGFLMTIALEPEPPSAAARGGALISKEFTIRFTGVGEQRGKIIDTHDFFFAPAVAAHLQKMQPILASQTQSRKLKGRTRS